MYLVSVLRLRFLELRRFATKNVASRVVTKVIHRRLQLKQEINCSRVFIQFIGQRWKKFLRVSRVNAQARYCALCTVWDITMKIKRWWK